MDESWRMRMGMMPTPPPRQRPSYGYQFPRSSADAASHRRQPISVSDDPLNPEDFSDVFGGPPQTILCRQFSSGFPRSSSSSSSSSSTSYFYEDIFWPPPAKAEPPARRSGRILPKFRIPGRRQRQEKNGFYCGIFGLEDERVVRLRSRSKTSSSSVLSSEELSPLRPAFSLDDDDSYLASKLRPINVRQQNAIPPFPNNQTFHKSESYAFGLSRRNASPETISLEPISDSSFRVSADDMDLNSPSPSPSSPVSSVCHSLRREVRRCELDDSEDEAMSSYVIEITSETREGTYESNGVDEAIAWAKEKSQTHYTESVQECEAPRH